MKPEDRLATLRSDLNRREVRMLAGRAAKSSEAKRRHAEEMLLSGYRQAFSTDVDRILHSRAYTRYIDKTQVFYLVENDHITHRVLHVQLVSKVARTIGRFLRLNEDLIEAAALGHDIGHPPFGHDGERFLSNICREHGIGHFRHNVQSVRFLDRVEKKGKGWNLTLPVLDAVLAHDGEVHDRVLVPASEKTFADHDAEAAAQTADPAASLTPMTPEGCVVRFSDTIAYIGRDVEDAIRLNLIRRSDLPAKIVRVLGDTNGTIVHRLVTDVISQSLDNPFIAFSDEVSDALGRLKAFNLERIYLNPEIKRDTPRIEALFESLFARFLEDIRTDRRDSSLFTDFLNGMSDTYIGDHRPAEIVRDFIAGMTDRYFLRLCPPEARPRTWTAP